MQFTAHVGSKLLKLRHGSTRYRHRFTLLGQRHRVVLHTVDAYLEVQMWPGRPAGGTNESDGLPLPHTLATLHHDLAQVRVNRFSVVAMLDEHHIAITVLTASKLHDAVAHGARQRPVLAAKSVPMCGATPGGLGENAWQNHC